VEATLDALARLGDAAGAPIVTPLDERVAEVARRHGGAAKPSGAGGGELAVVFALGEEALAAALAECGRRGAPPLPEARPARRGVRLLR